MLRNSVDIYSSTFYIIVNMKTMHENVEERWERILNVVMELSDKLWYQNSKFIAGVLLPSMEGPFDEGEYKSWFSSYISKLAIDNNWDDKYVRDRIN